ncbi:Hpt domain-containing protein [Oryzomonas japonica]|uniref:Hpt domain-containing protein n=1 Tax=Oryzomonas japonica TaxID=2603858 RepID=A0A7J4ZMC7_9BACT|nr:Hpt domain-containing protein [Oryzomonas japonica]KAB0663700.1 Hpt domain-containing protein [Oryzomonas japonica]
MTVDKLAVLERLNNDQELFVEICTIFKQDGPQLVRKLRDAVDAGQIIVAIRHAHSLKSSSATIGAYELSELARQAELAGNQGDVSIISALLPVIDAKLHEVIAELS